MGRIQELNQAAVSALERTAEALHTEVVQAQVMPRDTGAMQGERTFIKAGESTTAPQARRLYYHPEYNFQTDENPFAGGEWFKPWLPGGVSAGFAKEAFQRFYKKEAKI